MPFDELLRVPIPNASLPTATTPGRAFGIWWPTTFQSAPMLVLPAPSQNAMSDGGFWPWAESLLLGEIDMKRPGLGSRGTQEALKTSREQLLGLLVMSPVRQVPVPARDPEQEIRRMLRAAADMRQEMMERQIAEHNAWLVAMHTGY